MSIFFKLIAGFASTASVAAGVATFALTNKESVNSKVEKNINTVDPDSVIVGIRSTDWNQHKDKLFNQSTKNYFCQIAQKKDKSCEISIIKQENNQRTFYSSELNKLKTLSQKDVLNINSENKQLIFAKISFDSKGINNYESTAHIIKAFALNDDSELFNFQVLAVLKNNQLQPFFNTLFLVKTDDQFPESEFENQEDDNKYFCYKQDSLTTMPHTDITQNKCQVVFFKEEKTTDKTHDVTKFAFDDLKVSTSQDKQKIKKNMYLILKIWNSSEGFTNLTSTTPIYYYERTNSQRTLTKKLQFLPVMKLSGLLSFDSHNSENLIFVPETLIS